MRKLLGISMCAVAVAALLVATSYAGEEAATRVKGTVKVTKEGNADKVEIAVSDAEVLVVVGDKQKEVAKFDGKTVEAKGTVDKKAKKIHVTEVKEVEAK